MTLSERLAAFAHSVLPVWVYDHDQLCFRWANDKAVELWRAQSLSELLARDFSDSSAATRTRLDNYMSALRRGEQVVEDWTLYPQGRPATTALHGSGITLDDGRLAILFQAVVRGPAADLSTVRGIEALRHSSLMVTLSNLQGEILYCNPAALRAFGDVTHIFAWFSDAAVGLLEQVAGSQIYQVEQEVLTQSGVRWHAVEGRATIDPATGERTILIQQSDVTERRKAEDLAQVRSQLLEDLNRTIALAEQQRRQILSLSAPTLEVGPSILAVPFIGELSAERTDDVAQRLLPALQSQKSRFVILDFTGCDSVMQEGAAKLAQLVHATRLLGATVVVTGINAQLATTLVRSGTDLGELQTLRQLRDGIEYCRRRIGRLTD